MTLSILAIVSFGVTTCVCSYENSQYLTNEDQLYIVVIVEQNNDTSIWELTCVTSSSLSLSLSLHSYQDTYHYIQ